jgi:Domain of unknown function (DUF4111)
MNGSPDPVWDAERVPLEERVQQIVADYLWHVDRALPGVVEGLYLVGSLALDDFHPRTSDIDFVAVCRHCLDDRAIRALRRVHARVAKRPLGRRFSGPYVTWSELAAKPRRAVPGPHVGRNGTVSAGVQTGRDPVTWHTLARHGLALRGPSPDALDVWIDSVGLVSWTRRNLDDYWRRWLHRSSRLLSRPGMATLIDWGPAWGVLGVSRLHYTLTTGEISSKTGAGMYAREAFPSRWLKIIDECLRIRRDDPKRIFYRSRFERRRDALAFVDIVIADAQRLEHGD